MFNNLNKKRGFTLIELLVVIAIIGVLASIVVMALDQSRIKGRDAARKSQIQEVLKALELYYSDNNRYPPDGTPIDATTGSALTNISNTFYGPGKYLSRLPEESARYEYCTTVDGKSALLAVDTEDDRGGTPYCNVTRGPGGTSGSGCTAWAVTSANAVDLCSTRF